MPWTSLENRVNSLPLILAGPILRRVEPHSVSIWIALSKSSTIGMHLTPGIVDTGAGSGPFDNSGATHTATAATKRIGQHLHLALVTLTIPEAQVALTPQTLYSYNLIFIGDGPTKDLKSLGLLKDKTSHPKHLALGYQPRLLPNFVISPIALHHLNILHTSCRKAHGLGNVDAMQGIDVLIKKAGTDPLKRPHQLFLTGDQVYADDIAMPLLPMLTDAGKVLLGKKEKMPLNATEKIEINLNNLPTGRRMKTTLKTANFSSTAASCHAFSFGEYCALYLFYWSNALWTEDFPEDSVALTEPTPPPSKPEILSKLPANDDSDDDDEDTPAERQEKRQKKVDALKEKFKEEKEHLKVFTKALPKVMRLLANVPVYMMFDDHEVTDDWNLTAQWRSDVLAAPFGKRVLRNGLLGFALFQAWGNMPKYYESGIGAEILEKTEALFPDSTAEGPVAAPGDRLDVIFGLTDAEPLVQWHYTVKSGPTNTAVLDSRTQRELKGKYSPPGLIKLSSLLEQLPQTLVPTAGAEVLLVVATAPVLGLGIFEELLQPLASRIVDVVHHFKKPGPDEKLIKGHEDFDVEAWGLNPKNLEQFLAHLQPFKKVVFLSGDVHYGFTTKMEYWKKNEATTSSFIQLVASGAKNEIEGWKRSILPNATGQKIFEQAYIPMERKGWKNATTLIEEVDVPDGRVIPHGMRVRLNDNPVLLPTSGWPEGTQIDVPSDWSWRLEFVRDERADEDRPSKAQLSFGDTDIDPADAGTGYAKVLQRHEKFFKNNFSRRINWNANIGKVTFSGTGTTLKVKHQLYFYHPQEPQPNDPQPYMEFEAALTPSDAPEPVIPRTL
ncbi:MAG: hypothetical protein AAGF96_11700 [Bacteroidota bacterium]